jgi:FdhD protein
MNLVNIAGIQVRDGEASTIDDRVVCEERFCLFINDTRFIDLVASRNDLAALGAGFMVCQGLSRTVDSVTVKGNEIRVFAPVERSCEREMETTGSVGFLCRPPERVVSGCTISIPEVHAITKEIVTELWKETGGVHCSVIARDGEIMAKASDVGRHNTVDKVVGYAVLNGIDPGECVVGCTGRQPRDMVVKYANAGIPVIISRAASTNRGISAAAEFGITLICFSRDDRFTVYTHPERVHDLMREPGSRAGKPFEEGGEDYSG